MLKKEIVLFENKKDCCGCGACAQVCPKSAIDMVEDEAGFIYPVIREDRCIHCSKCVNSCSYKMSDNKTIPKEAYASLNDDVDIERNSASGGVFASLAIDFINNGGYVVGAVEQFAHDNIVVFHKVSNNIADIKEMQGSKYVQSDSSASYGQILELIESGKEVLFSGTPCQVDAVRKLTKNASNLYTIDVICHGVPSQKLFRDFLKSLEKDFKITVAKFVFRSKGASSKGFNAAIFDLKGNTKYEIPHVLLSYYKLFLNGYIYRKNCYSCPYAGPERVGDLTIGDYWGIENQHIEEIKRGIVDPSKYWSSILVNSDKGSFLLDRNNTLKLVPSSFDKIAAKNKQLKEPSKEPVERDALISDYEKNGYEAVENNYRKKVGGVLKFKIKQKLWIKKYRY